VPYNLFLKAITGTASLNLHHHIKPVVMKSSRFYLFLLIVLILKSTNAFNQTTPSANLSFTVENYYKVKWGFADEFISLWKKNHYPLLKKAIEKGDIISVTAEKPRLHSGEDTRWDFKVTIVFKTAALAFDENLTNPYKKMLYTDLDKLTKDEQHRFELLISHWDVMTESVALD
jgi:hypothetical protein